MSETTPSVELDVDVWVDVFVGQPAGPKMVQNRSREELLLAFGPNAPTDRRGRVLQQFELSLPIDGEDHCWCRFTGKNGGIVQVIEVG